MKDSSGVCDVVQSRLEIYSDGELSLSDRQELESHLEVCEICSAMNQRLQLLKAATRNGLSSTAPVGLKRKIRQNLRQLTSDNSRQSLPVISWLGIFGGIISAVSLTVWLTILVPAIQDLPLQKQIVAAHIGSLQADHLSDVTSSDQHTIKPWFNGKIDFSPKILNFTSQGYYLIGGRLEYLYGKNIVAVVYKRRKHIINLFIWPADTPEISQNVSGHYYNGYNLLAWKAKGMRYWLVSDLNSKELNLFFSMIKKNQKSVK